MKVKLCFIHNLVKYESEVGFVEFGCSKFSLSSIYSVLANYVTARFLQMSALDLVYRVLA